jgi:hypothetical protein
MDSRDIIVSAAGAGSGTVVIPSIRGDATSREQDMIEKRIGGIKRKRRQPIEERAQMVLAGSNAMSLTTALNDNIVTSQIMTQMQQAITSDAVSTTKQYAMVIAQHTDISIAAIAHRTAELVDNLKGKRKQVKSLLYDMVWQGRDSVVDFIDSAVGNKTLEETIRANEAIVVALVNKYIAENSPPGGEDMPAPVALEAILRMDVTNPTYIELVGAQQRAAKLFYFSVWGRSAVTDMNIEIREAIEDFNGRGMPMLPRTNEDQVNVDALSTAREYNAALVRPDPADADADADADPTEKWIKFMLYLGLSEIIDSDQDNVGVNGAKYYGIPANIQELEDNLRTDFVETTSRDLTDLGNAWTFYTNPEGPMNSGASSVGYLARINAIIASLNEDGGPEINRVIDYIRGNKAQVVEIYQGVKWGHAAAFMKADADYAAAKKATAASEKTGALRHLKASAEALRQDITRVHDEYQTKKASEKAAEKARGRTLTRESKEEYLDAKEHDDARRADNDDRGRSRSPRNDEDTLAKQLVEEYEAANTMASMKGAKKGGRGRATKKRHPSRAAKKTRKGKRGKAGRMSRKTRKATRGRKAKKAKKTRKTRKHARRSKARR